MRFIEEPNTSNAQHVNGQQSSTSSTDQHATTPTQLPKQVTKRSSRVKQPPLWMNDFISLTMCHQDTPYPISKYITYDNVFSKYQAYLFVLR